MLPEIRKRHLAGEKEGNWPGEEAENDQQSTKGLQNARDSQKGGEVNRCTSSAYTAECAEQLLESVQRKRKAGYDPQKR